MSTKLKFRKRIKKKKVTASYPKHETQRHHAKIDFFIEIQILFAAETARKKPKVKTQWKKQTFIIRKMVKHIIKASPTIQEERKTLDQLNDERHLEWSVKELNTRTSKEQTKINLQNKHLKMKVLKKLKQHQKNNHDLVLGYFNPRW